MNNSLSNILDMDLKTFYHHKPSDNSAEENTIMLRLSGLVQYWVSQQEHSETAREDIVQEVRLRLLKKIRHSREEEPLDGTHLLKLTKTIVSCCIADWTRAKYTKSYAISVEELDTVLKTEIVSEDEIEALLVFQACWQVIKEVAEGSPMPIIIFLLKTDWEVWCKLTRPDSPCDAIAPIIRITPEQLCSISDELALSSIQIATFFQEVLGKQIKIGNIDVTFQRVKHILQSKMKDVL